MSTVINATETPTYNPSQLKLIQQTVARDTTADEFDMFMEHCRRRALDPFKKQIYCMVFNKDNPDKRQVAFVESIDGYRSIAERQGNYRPDDEEPAFEMDETLEGNENPKGIVKAKARVYKQDNQGNWHAVTGTARWDEFAPLYEIWEGASGSRRPTGKYKLDERGNWKKMPFHMLAKCAEAQALRKGWPEDLSGSYIMEEVDQMRSAELASQLVAEADEADRLKLLGGSNTYLLAWQFGGELEPVPEGQVVDRVAEWVADNEPAAVEWFKSFNRHAINQFWAKNKSDALHIKRVIDAKIDEIAA